MVRFGPQAVLVLVLVLSVAVSQDGACPRVGNNR